MTTKLTAGGVIALVLIPVAAFLMWKTYKGGAAVMKGAANIVTHDLNPASQDNLINRGVSAVGAAVSGNAGWSLGGWIYDATHSTPTALQAPAVPVVDQSIMDAWDARTKYDQAGTSGANGVIASDPWSIYSDPANIGLF